MNTELENTLRSWLGTSPPVQPLRLQTEHMDVVVSWRDYVHPHGNTFSSMPSEAHDVRDNPLYTVLKSKQDQLRSAPSGTRRAIFLGDAGCHLLRDIRPMTQGLRTVSGYDIIQTFLSDTDIDFVAVFVPKYQNEYAIVQYNSDNPRLWHLYVFDRKSEVPLGEFDRLSAIRDLLPNPFLHESIKIRGVPWQALWKAGRLELVSH